VPTVVKKDTGKEYPQWSRDPPRRHPPPPIRGRGQVAEEKYWPALGRNGPWEEDVIGLAAFEDYEED
jgi:hypothetical protein